MDKITIFDTHCHLADQRYQEQNKNTEEIIQEAEQAGVKYILNTGQDMPTNQLLLKQLKNFPNLFGSLGLHPNSEEDLKEENLKWIEQQSNEDKNKFLDAFTDAYEIVKETEIKKGILHCFAGNWEVAEKFLNLGFYVSFA
ncbi:13699_t:CDS:2, partial [Funneliformis geosporum]